MRILIVDDKHEDELKTVTTELSKLDHLVDTIGDGLETLAYLQDYHLKVDLILMDELLKPGSHYQSGALLGKEISKKHPMIPLVLYTGSQKNEQKMHQVWTECGFSDIFLKEEFDSDIAYNLNGISALESVKTKFENKHDHCDELLYMHFNGLAEPDRQYLLKAIDEDNQALLKQYTISVDDKPFLAVDLMLNPVNAAGGHPLSTYFKYYLDQTKKNYQFRGKWNETAMQHRLEQYWGLSRSESKKLKDEIDIKAFEILVNIFIIQYLINDHLDPGQIAFLNARNKNISATAGVANKKNGFRNFIDKLICRRVAIGFDAYCSISPLQEFERTNVAALLRHGSTDPRIDSAGGVEDYLHIPSVYATNLGLFTDQVTERVETDDNKIFEEEINWLEKYAKYAQRMANFLKEFNFPSQQVKPFDKVKLRPAAGELTDTIDFRDYISELKKKVSKEDLSTIEDYIDTKIRNELPETLTVLVKRKSDYSW